jgi:hypothetical protein
MSEEREKAICASLRTCAVWRGAALSIEGFSSIRFFRRFLFVHSSRFSRRNAKTNDGTTQAPPKRAASPGIAERRGPHFSARHAG